MSGMLRAVTGKLKDIASDIITIRTGTVASDYAPMTSTQVTLDNDPDGVLVQALCLNQPLAVNTRVMMVAYPPRGLAIVGTMGQLPTTVDSGWIAPTLTNSWVNYGSGYELAGYRLIGNQMHLRGTLKNGVVGSAILTLPVGFRPTAGHVIVPSIIGILPLQTGTVAGGPTPNLTGAASAGTAHTHDLQGHNHSKGTFAVQDVAIPLQIGTDGVVLQYQGTNSYISINCSFFID